MPSLSMIAGVESLADFVIDSGSQRWGIVIKFDGVPETFPNVSSGLMASQKLSLMSIIWVLMA